MKLNALCTFIFFTLITGCASTGNQFDDSNVSRIIDGETTKQQIVAWFGQPSGTHSNSHGLTAYTYSYAEAQTRPESFIPYVGAFVGGTDSEAKTLTVWFDQNDVVDSHGYAQHESSSGVIR